LQHYVHEVFGVRPDIVNGDTATSPDWAENRHTRIRLFQERPGFGVIILSPMAVGFGLNIQAANHVVHYMRAWNPAREDQATDRVYRIGQQKDVLVYYPCAHAEDFVTFDVKLDQLLDQKRALAQDLLNGAGDLLPGDFTIDEVVPGGTAESLDRVTASAVQSMLGRLRGLGHCPVCEARF
jgi:SNF2 family DNA or RNA helicase